MRACPSITGWARRAQGWHIAMATAGFERGLMLRSPARFQVAAQRLVQLWRRRAHEADPALVGAVAQAWMDAEAYALNTYRTASRLMAGGTIGVEASLNKIFWSELDLNLHRTRDEPARCARRAAAAGPTTAKPMTGSRGSSFRSPGPIYAGTNEIQRNLIAERLLGLPRG